MKNPDVIPGSLATLNDAAVLSTYRDAELRAHVLLRESVVNRLAATLLADLKADCPPPPPTTTQQAAAVLRTVSLRLEEAAQALFAAADRMKKHGDPHGASLTYAAAQRAQLAAQALD